MVHYMEAKWFYMATWLIIWLEMVHWKPNGLRWPLNFLMASNVHWKPKGIMWSLNFANIFYDLKMTLEVKTEVAIVFFWSFYMVLTQICMIYMVI